MAALANVEAQQQVSIAEGVSRTHAKLTYSISRAQLGSCSLEVPDDQKVVNVLDANVRQWSVEPSGKLQKITVQLFEPAKDVQTLGRRPGEVHLGQGRGPLEVPVVGASARCGSKGVVAVELGEGLRAETLRKPRAVAARPGRSSSRNGSRQLDLLLSLRRASLRVGLEHRESRAADRRRFAVGSVSRTGAAIAGLDASLPHRTGRRLPARTGSAAGLRRVAASTAASCPAPRP